MFFLKNANIVDPEQRVSVLANKQDKIDKSLQVVGIQNNENISRIILVTRDTDIEFCQKEIVAKYNFDKVSDVIAGGKERYAFCWPFA